MNPHPTRSTALLGGLLAAATITIASPSEAANDEPHFVLNVPGDSPVLRPATSATETEDGYVEAVFDDGAHVLFRHGAELDDASVVAVLDETADAATTFCTTSAGCDAPAIVAQVTNVLAIPPHLVGPAEDLIIEATDIARLDSIQMQFGSLDFLHHQAAMQSLNDFLHWDIYNQMVGYDWSDFFGGAPREELGPQLKTFYDGQGGSITYAYDKETDTWYEVWENDGVHFDENDNQVEHKRGDRKEGGRTMKRKGNSLIWMGPYFLTVPAPTVTPTWNPVDFVTIMVNTSMFSQLATYAQQYPDWTHDEIANVATQILAHPAATFWAY